MINNSKLLGIILFVYGFFELLNISGIVGVTSGLLLGFLLLGYGVINVFINLGSNQRSWLMLGNLLFFIGLFLILSGFYQIIQKDHLFFTLFLFVLANSALLLFIENSKEHVFLYISLFLFALSFFAGRVINLLSGFSALANIGIVLLAYWPIFLIFFGIAVLVNRKN